MFVIRVVLLGEKIKNDYNYIRETIKKHYYGRT